MKNTRKQSLRPLAAVLACVLIAVQMIPACAASRKYDGRIRYPCVLVHGLGGWGENAPQGDIPYFGATTGSLARYLRTKGYTVCVPSVGPYSSTWDRVCELYAQLTGTRTDYGAAHAKAHNHARYGRTYDALVPDWGQEINDQLRKIDLVSHSFGGPTVSMLASLLAFGNEAETAATGSETSPLFTGGKADWVQSVTTLCSPHNGAQLTCMVDDLGSVAGVNDTTNLLVGTIFKFIKTIDEGVGTPDLMLDQFGIGSNAGSEREVEASLKKVAKIGNDHAFYDLSPDGAAELNEKIRTVDGVYYFSYAFCTTKAAPRLRSRVPDSDTPLYLYPLALAIGSYTGTSAGGIRIGKSWQDNDGLVSVVSAQHPADEPYAAYPADASELQPGVWYVMPTRRGNHASAVGGLADAKDTRNFFESILNRDAALPR